MHSPILALDLGMRRTGVALNPTGSVILDLATIQHLDAAVLIAAVQALIAEHEPTGIIIGAVREKTELAALADTLHQELSIPITTLDETLTTKEAERQLQVERGGDSDARAARLLLEQYLAERGDHG